MADHGHLLRRDQPPHRRLFRVDEKRRGQWIRTPHHALLYIGVEDCALVDNARLAFVRRYQPLITVQTDVRVVGGHQEAGQGVQLADVVDRLAVKRLGGVAVADERVRELLSSVLDLKRKKVFRTRF